MRGKCNCTEGQRQDEWTIKELDYTSKNCPVRDVTPASWKWLELFQHYNHGYLPYSGGIMAQPNAFAEAMMVIQSEINSNE